MANLGVYQTAGRLEELVEGPDSHQGRIADVVELLAGALEADGAALVSADPTMAATTYRLGSASAQLLGRALASSDMKRPFLALEASKLEGAWSELAETRRAASILVVPLVTQGRNHFLYLDRLVDSGRSSFGVTQLNLCLALMPQVNAVLRRLHKQTGPTADPTRNIYLADVVTQNEEMLRILRLVEKVSRSDLTVLLKGETGTGKTLIAKALHKTSDRADKPFVTVDCAALPDNLLESELFGYVKGGVYGSNKRQKGTVCGSRRRNHIPGRNRQGGYGCPAASAALVGSGRDPAGRFHVLSEAVGSSGLRHEQRQPSVQTRTAKSS